MVGSSRHRSRRGVIRLLSLGALALPLGLRPRAARAIIGWCRRDPIIQINGLTCDIVLSSYLEMLDLATGPTRIDVTVPPGIATRLVATDPGFGGFGYDVDFAESPNLTATDGVIEVQIEVFAPALDLLLGPLPLRIAFTPRGVGRPDPNEAEGQANEPVVLLTSIPATHGAQPGLPLAAGPTVEKVRGRKARKHGKKRRGKKGSR